MLFGGIHKSSRVWAPFAVSLAVILVSLLVVGCGVETGPTQVLSIDEPLGAAAVTDVEIDMGAGTLSVRPGAVGLASGSIQYNVPSWEPSVRRTDSSLKIEQGGPSVKGLGTDIVNRWELQLGSAPMNLHVSAGAYEGTYDLSGLTLGELTIKDGAARAEVLFNSPNPGQMSRLLYETGASTVKMTGLANANFRSMEFEGGAGSYSLDFSGQLRSDSTVRVKAGVGSLRIVVPADTPARISVDTSLTDISQEGSWDVLDETYSTPAFGADGQTKSLFITVDMDVGSLTLAAK